MFDGHKEEASLKEQDVESQLVDEILGRTWNARIRKSRIGVSGKVPRHSRLGLGARTFPLRIDDEFSTLIPPHTAEELQQLEKLLVAEGCCRDPLVTWRGILIEGHARYRICKDHRISYKTKEINLPNREAVTEWIIRNQLGKRNLGTEGRCRLALALEPFIAAQAKERQQTHGGTAPGRASLVADSPQLKTREVLAKIAGVSPRTMQDYLTIQRHLTPEQVASINRGETTITHVRNEIRIAHTIEKRNALRAATEPDSLGQLHVGDFRGWDIPDNSLDMILTDPPWAPSKENLQLLADLAVFAERKLVDGGSLVCYLGQLLVGHAAAAFGQRLDYHWIFGGVRERGRIFNQSDSYRMLNKWRCVVWFVKGNYLAPRAKALCDVLPQCDSERLYHEWQEPLAESVYLIDGICPPNGLVGDPMICSGTTAIAAERTGRRWLGCEIDARIASVASKRIKEERWRVRSGESRKASDR